MSQLASGQRSGLARSTHLCTSCLQAWSSQLQQPPIQRSMWTQSGAATHRQYATARPKKGSPAASEEAEPASSPPAKRGRPASSTKRARSTITTVAQASKTQLKLWRETLVILKKLEAVQERLAEQGQGAAGSDRNITGDDDASQVLPAISAAEEARPGAIKKAVALAKSADSDGPDQVKMLTSALHLLKTVLSTQGQQQEQATDQSKDSGETNEIPEGRANRATRRKAQKKKEAAEAATTSEKQRPPLVTFVASKDSGPSRAKRRAQAAAQAAAEAAAEVDGGAAAEADADADTTATESEKPTSSKKKATESPYQVNRVNSKHLELTPVDEEVRPVPKLSYGLDRALFNPGVYHLQDPRSRVFNFDPYLATIMPIREFDFNALKQYVTSSKDPTLISMAARLQKKYSGSTSSMTSMLSHFHFLLSSWRPIDAGHMSRSFSAESLNFTRITKAPAATFLHWKDGTYAIDADKEFDTANILSMLGKSMEKLLTLSKDDFEKYRVSKSHELTDAERNDPEAFHYTTFGDFLMRSQLDAHDERLPGSGMFDLKTRAVVSIRMDAQAFQQGLGYEIRQRFGQWESFEREYFDMIRSAFLKYSLQVRMGRMDGIYVAFHNTRRIFGFQYISINEMDKALHGTDDRTLGDREFMLSLDMLNAVLDRATKRFPGRSLRLHFETRPSEVAPFMYIFAKPVEPEEIEEVQTANKASVDAFEQKMLGIVAGDAKKEVLTAETDAIAEESPSSREEEEEDEQEEEEEEEDDVDSQSFDVWESMRQKVEETMENETLGIASVRETIEDALEQSGLLRGRSPDETRGYVDALLDAVTQPDTEKVAESILNEGETRTETDDETGAVTEVQDEEAGKAAEETATADSSEEPASFESENPAVEKEAAAEETIEEAVEVAQDADDTPSSSQQAVSVSGPGSQRASDTISLKDLIIKLADQVEAAQTDVVEEPEEQQQQQQQQQQLQPHEDDDGSMAVGAEGTDGYKNKRFERILTEMMVRSKKAAKAVEPKKGGDDGKTESLGAASGADTADAELLGMILTLRNKVNGQYVARPEQLTKHDAWVVEYAIEEMQPATRTHSLYEMVRKRRRALLGPRQAKSTAFDRDYMARLQALSAKGRQYRKEENRTARKQPVRVYGVDEKLVWDDIFSEEEE
ncbi:mitochondrial mRNA processing protein [Grosmannia clavigera kw1407]|uniref:Mitochondrial mRNA processing protein n=1 Tax=Grosmannia clavigera (strain kw1407 / UAMH 11150) TaxID=655863 RepID=F0X8U6_GROCL|nr:mitochondrial mRNA processing protein [Grosmannia clavigera kw1407]EFX05692.1 mitochondrial mRNA processing protein [Grosmannia clavigera kw1407]